VHFPANLGSGLDIFIHLALNEGILYFRILRLFYLLLISVVYWRDVLVIVSFVSAIAKTAVFAKENILFLSIGIDSFCAFWFPFLNLNRATQKI